MKVAIMQPYLFSYPGYFQLIRNTDLFLIHDDVQWIKGGWINRNFIYLQGAQRLWTLPVTHDSSHAPIYQRRFVTAGRAVDKPLKMLREAYSKAIHFPEVMPLLEEMLTFENRCVSELIKHSIVTICDHLSIGAKIEFTSRFSLGQEITGQEKVIELCNQVKASTYVNPLGGAHLYSERDFQEHQIQLKFLRPSEGSVTYAPRTHQALSIIHDLMNLHPNDMVDRLDSCELIEPEIALEGHHA